MEIEIPIKFEGDKSKRHFKSYINSSLKSTKENKCISNKTIPANYGN